MKYFNWGFIFCTLSLAFIVACKNEGIVDTSSIATDSLSIAQGKRLFTQQCAACHSFSQEGIGPPLGGLTKEVNTGWIKSFILNPKKIIDAGDKRGQQLMARYKSYMIPFPGLDNQSLDQIVAYMHTQDKPVFASGSDTLPVLANPYPDTIPMSDLVVGLKYITQFPASDSNKFLRTRITKLGFEPSSKNLFVLDLRGKLYRLKNDQPVVYLDMPALRPKFIHTPGLATGFGSFAFHPEFSKNGLLYTTHTEPANTAKADFGYADSIPVALQWVLTEWTTKNPGEIKFTGTGRELVRINVESVIHGVQEIDFNLRSNLGDEDYGLLYIGVGDGGSVEHGYPQLAHNLHTVWGNVLRIDPRGNNAANGQYGIPATNPFVDEKENGALGEIYARGFRNPHRITWTKAGQMLVSNIGHANIESLNLILPGHDYGWPITEGPFMIDIKGNMKNIFARPAAYDQYNITYPVAAFDHDEGLAITGGYEYTGTQVPSLEDKFLFGDIPKGRLFYVNTSDISLGRIAPIKEWQVSVDGKLKTLKELCGNDRVDLHFGKDAAGEIYILTKPDGKVYKLID